MKDKLDKLPETKEAEMLSNSELACFASSSKKAWKLFRPILLERQIVLQKQYSTLPTSRDRQLFRSALERLSASRRDFYLELQTDDSLEKLESSYLAMYENHSKGSVISIEKLERWKSLINFIQSKELKRACYESNRTEDTVTLFFPGEFYSTMHEIYQNCASKNPLVTMGSRHIQLDKGSMKNRADEIETRFRQKIEDGSFKKNIQEKIQIQIERCSSDDLRKKDANLQKLAEYGKQLIENFNILPITILLKKSDVYESAVSECISQFKENANRLGLGN